MFDVTPLPLLAITRISSTAAYASIASVVRADGGDGALSPPPARLMADWLTRVPKMRAVSKGGYLVVTV